MSPQADKKPVDMKKTFLYFILAALLLLVLSPVMIFIHEMGHVIAILLLGGEVTGFHISWFSGSVTYNGLESARALFLVHLSGVLANMIVGAALIFHVWRYKGHPFIEALSLVWGIVMFLLDFVNYTIYDIFGDHGGDFDKIYEAYPMAIPVFIIVDIVLVILIIILLTRKEFWKGIQLPRKTV
ncbi:MAG: M50 family metallopeptidase [Thermoplasmata archaeon]|nr:MAG: M50 family metallopeptidase [Thermoplasmata archaeon]